MSLAPVLVPAIWPNAALEAWYRRKLREMIDAVHASMALHVCAAYKRQPSTLGFAADNSSSVELMHTLERWSRHWRHRLDDMAAEIASAFARRSFARTQFSMMDALKRAGFTVRFKPTRKSIEAYRAVLAENVNLIKSVPQQYLTDVQTQVWQSVMKGSDLTTLSRGLRESYGVSTRRAALISRDQSAKAKAVIERVRRQELGITHAIWRHSHAGKTPRPTHVKMDGKRFKIADGMYDADEGKRVHPGELINCRCTSRSILLS